MKNTLLPRLFTLVCLGLVLAPVAEAQMLDDTWFKVKVSVKGRRVSAEPELEVSNYKTKGVFYVNVRPGIGVGEDGSETYTFDVISPVSDDNFAVSGSGVMATLGSEENLLVDSELGNGSEGVRWTVRTLGKNAGVLQLLFLAQLKIKKDMEGGLKSASFKSLGGSVPFGATGLGDDVNSVFGSMRLSGKLIPLEKLPFAT